MAVDADDGSSIGGRRPRGAIPGQPTCLYPSEAEIGELVLGRKKRSHWRGLAVILERDGLPRVDPEFGGRYWPAVKAFLNHRNHIADCDPTRRPRR